MNAPVARALLALAFAGGGTAGQEPPPTRPTPQPAQPPSPTAVHKAWITEVLDLDPRRAAQLYARVADDPRTGNPWRWIAIARRSELQRLDVAGGTRIDPSEAPGDLQAAFAAADNTLDVHALVARVSGDPEAVQQHLASADDPLPPIRPYVGAAEDFVIDQLRNERGEPGLRRPRTTAGNRTSFNENVYAPQVLRAELTGTRAQADATRALYLPRWQPPPQNGTAAINLQRIRHNMRVLLTERESWRLRPLFEQLQTRIEELAKSSPDEAVALVRRLPRYGERLLTPIPDSDK